MHMRATTLKHRSSASEAPRVERHRLDAPFPPHFHIVAYAALARGDVLGRPSSAAAGASAASIGSTRRCRMASAMAKAASGAPSFSIAARIAGSLFLSWSESELRVVSSEA